MALNTTTPTLVERIENVLTGALFEQTISQADADSILADVRELQSEARRWRAARNDPWIRGAIFPHIRLRSDPRDGDELDRVMDIFISEQENG